jgi:hypothetical protein
MGFGIGRMGAGFGRLGAQHRAGAGPSYSEEAIALFEAFTSQPDADRKGVIDTFIVALKTAGIWTELDILYVTAAHDAQAARLNWKSPGTFTLTPTNSPTFTTDRGYAGDGSTSRLATGFTPSTHGVNFIQNDAGLWVWVESGTAANHAEIGSLSVSPQARIKTMDSTNLNALIAALNAGSIATGAVQTTPAGLSGISRAVSGTVKLWKNGAQSGSNGSVTSTGVPTQEQWLCAANATLFSTKRVAMGAWGSALTGLESSFYTAALAYMQAVGAAA